MGGLTRSVDTEQRRQTTTPVSRVSEIDTKRRKKRRRRREEPALNTKLGGD